MDTHTQDAGNQIDARKPIRSWSWGRSKKKSVNPAEAEMARPWAGVAEWLRVAHSLLDEQTADQASQVSAIE